MQNEIKSYFKTILENYFNLLQQNKRAVSKKPTEVYLSVTESCCLECKMCNIWKIKEKQKPLDYKTAKKIIDILVDWLGYFNLTFAGGEPFLNKDILKIIKYANQKNIKTSTNSNGYIIDKKLAEKICKSGLSTIFFSIDGLEKEHDFIRGKKNTFKRVTQAINNIKHANSKIKPQVYINTVISKNNLGIITKLVDLAKKLDVKGINFQTLMPNFASTYKNYWWKTNPFWPNNKTWIIKNIEGLIEYKNRYGSFILNSYGNIKKIKSYFLNPQKFQQTEKCFVGLNNLMVDSYGNIKLCYEMPPIGNIFKNNPNQIWSGTGANIIREKIEKCKKPCKLLPCNFGYFQNVLKRKLKKLFINLK